MRPQQASARVRACPFLVGHKSALSTRVWPSPLAIGSVIGSATELGSDAGTCELPRLAEATCGEADRFLISIPESRRAPRWDARRVGPGFIGRPDTWFRRREVFWIGQHGLIRGRIICQVFPPNIEGLRPTGAVRSACFVQVFSRLYCRNVVEKARLPKGAGVQLARGTRARSMSSLVAAYPYWLRNGSPGRAEICGLT